MIPHRWSKLSSIKKNIIFILLWLNNFKGLSSVSQIFLFTWSVLLLMSFFFFLHFHLTHISFNCMFFYLFFMISVFKTSHFVCIFFFWYCWILLYFLGTPWALLKQLFLLLLFCFVFSGALKQLFWIFYLVYYRFSCLCVWLLWSFDCVIVLWFFI